MKVPKLTQPRTPCTRETMQEEDLYEASQQDESECFSKHDFESQKDVSEDHDICDGAPDMDQFKIEALGRVPMRCFQSQDTCSTIKLLEGYNETQMEAVAHFKDVALLLKDVDDEAFALESSMELGLKTTKSAMQGKRPAGIPISKKPIRKMKSTTKIGAKGVAVRGKRPEPSPLLGPSLLEPLLSD